jgi:predicted Fe-Mo cluster-binding NifX family protein
MIKIAFPTDDGATISRHFGRAAFFQVATVTEGDVVQWEQRAKPAHGQHEHHESPGLIQVAVQEHGRHEDHEHDHGHNHNHGPIFALLDDCQVVIAAGMGQPAYEQLLGRGLTIYMTGEKTIATALSAYQSGSLETDVRRVHAHH